MKNKAQGTVEYTVLILLILAALFGIQVYFQRGIYGRVRGNADELSGGFAYSPGGMSSNAIVNRVINESTDSHSEKRDDYERTIYESDYRMWQWTDRQEEVLEQVSRGETSK